MRAGEAGRARGEGGSGRPRWIDEWAAGGEGRAGALLRRLGGETSPSRTNDERPSVSPSSSSLLHPSPGCPGPASPSASANVSRAPPSSSFETSSSDASSDSLVVVPVCGGGTNGASSLLSSASTTCGSPCSRCSFRPAGSPAGAGAERLRNRSRRPGPVGAGPAPPARCTGVSLARGAWGVSSADADAGCGPRVDERAATGVASLSVRGGEGEGDRSGSDFQLVRGTGSGGEKVKRGRDGAACVEGGSGGAAGLGSGVSACGLGLTEEKEGGRTLNRWARWLKQAQQADLALRRRRRLVPVRLALLLRRLPARQRREQAGVRAPQRAHGRRELPLVVGRGAAALDDRVDDARARRADRVVGRLVRIVRAGAAQDDRASRGVVLDDRHVARAVRVDEVGRGGRGRGGRGEGVAEARRDAGLRLWERGVGCVGEGCARRRRQGRGRGG